MGINKVLYGNVEFGGIKDNVNLADGIQNTEIDNPDANPASQLLLGDWLANLGGDPTKGDVNFEQLIKNAGTLGGTVSAADKDLAAKLEKLVKALSGLKGAHEAEKKTLTALEQKLSDEKAKGKSADQKLIQKYEQQIQAMKEAKKQTEDQLKLVLDKANQAQSDLKDKPEYLKFKSDANTGKTAEQFEDTLKAAQDYAKGFGSGKPTLKHGKAGKPGGAAVTGGDDGGPDDPSKTQKQPTQNANGADNNNGGNGTGGGLFGKGKAGGGLPGSETFGGMDPQQLLANLGMDTQLGAMDDINKMQLQSNKLLMLFFFLARMAMSGDLGAMYQFLRFVGFIITKDKAMQNVQMSKKLIDLQEQSRKLTKLLTDTKSYDKDDQSVQAKYSQLVEQVKADQGVIGTEQKLIGGMLEEFAQVSEMMTNMTKAMLDARGRELQTISSWRV